LGACLIRALNASRFCALVRTTRQKATYSLARMAIQTEARRRAVPTAIVRMPIDKTYVRSLKGTPLATTASKLRANIYRMLDEVLETGQPLEIERNGKMLVIAPKEKQSIWDRLPRREGAIVGDPDELIHIDWSSEWNPDPN
jgi:hypothetical protein